jgi:sigma-B regulation protein RsbU (phosphoserine phosphatase)
LKSNFPKEERTNVKLPLKILHLEDNPNDARLVRDALERESIPCATTCVKTQADFVAALEAGGIDLVLSDFTMPGFDGLSAAEIVLNRWPAVPFIFVSGTLGEERAGEAIKGGATDYVLKDDLVRLAPIVRLAMQNIANPTEGAMEMTKSHNRGMFFLPLDGRWQTETQLMQQTGMGAGTRAVYRDLVDSGFCERKIVPILSQYADAGEFMRMYRATWKMRRAYWKALKQTGIAVR